MAIQSHHRNLGPVRQSRTMDFLTSSKKVVEPQTAPITRNEPRCRRCGAPLRRAQNLLDLRTGHTVRLLVCTCGEAHWPDDVSN